MANANVVIDISHYQTVSDWGAVRAAGILGVIHKATQGVANRDPQYAARKAQAKAAGFLWGAYHYASGDDPVAQADAFLAYAQPDPADLVCLDYEASTSGPNMTLAQMLAFVGEIEKRLGRLPVIYGGNLLRETTANAGQTILSACPLWFSRYASAPTGLPAPWKTWTLWQYTDGNVGPEPHTVAGIGPVDRDMFNGDEATLKATWPFTFARAAAVA